MLESTRRVSKNDFQVPLRGGGVRVVRFRDSRLLALTCLLTISSAIDLFGETGRGLASGVVQAINRTLGIHVTCRGSTLCLANN